MIDDHGTDDHNHDRDDRDHYDKKNTAAIIVLVKFFVPFLQHPCSSLSLTAYVM